MKSAVVLFTRDLRLHDNPTLRAALDASETVLPLFVLDDGITRTRYGAAANRRAFLAESLVDLDASLRRAGAALDVRRGDVVAETVKAVRRVGAEAVFVSADVSPYARERERRLGAEVDLRVVDASFVVPAGEVAPSGGTHYQVFTPYYRAWLPAWRGEPHGTPRAIRLPEGATAKPPAAPRKASLVPGGESAGAELARRWLRDGLAGYGTGHDAVGDDATSRLSPYLHFGCVSARALAATRERAGRGGVRPPALLARLLRAAPLGPARDRHRTTSARGATAGSTTRSGSRRGRRAGPATRSSTPACGSCARRGGCTIARGSSSPRSS